MMGIGLFYETQLRIWDLGLYNLRLSTNYNYRIQLITSCKMINVHRWIWMLYFFYYSNIYLFIIYLLGYLTDLSGLTWH